MGEKHHNTNLASEYYVWLYTPTWAINYLKFKRG